MARIPAVQRRVGGTIEVLRYYRGIGWITRDVEADLRGYFGGLTTARGGEAWEWTSTPRASFTLRGSRR
jgi:archaellum component FlaD/FlaE